jgi:DNA-binding HxlR family transcriptional regulator
VQTYGQFCPLAKAAEIFAERWMPLIIRDLLVGARRFSDLQAGIPMISRAMLSQRLGELMEAGIVTTREQQNRRWRVYELTEAGQALRPIVVALSDWGQRYGRDWLALQDFDDVRLIFAMRRYAERDALPPQRLTLRIEIAGIPGHGASHRTWWLVFNPDDIELCPENPGHDVDVVITASLDCLTRVWLGHVGLREAQALHISGGRDDVARVKALLGLKDQAWLRSIHFDAEPVQAFA